MDTVLEASGLFAGYQKQPVVRDVSLTVGKGEVVALLGVNGAGKTTTMRTLAGLLPVLGGEVRLHDETCRDPLHRRARKGLAYVSEQRSVFMQMSTIDNLKVARCDVQKALDLFPELESRLKVKVGLLSGGEQQMLALARWLARGPSVLLADELSLGLAPLVVDRLLAAVRQSADSGIGVLLVEQHISKVMQVADRYYLLSGGQVRMSGRTEDLGGRLEDIEAAYFASESGPAPMAEAGHDDLTAPITARTEVAHD